MAKAGVCSLTRSLSLEEQESSRALTLTIRKFCSRSETEGVITA